MGGFVILSYYNQKFSKAITELRERAEAGTFRRLSFFLELPFYAINKALKMRPLPYAKLPEILLRNVTLFILLMFVINLLIAHDKGRVLQLDWWTMILIGTFVYTALVTPIMISRFKRLNLTRWEDL